MTAPRIDAVHVLVLVVTNLASCFILEQGCLVYPPCFCIYSEGPECSGQSLTTFPKFRVTVVDKRFQFLTFILHDNLLTTIPADAFKNITVLDNVPVYIELYVNYISSIETNAFRGIANQIRQLNLNGNNLRHIPPEVATLVQLDDLLLWYNPIISLDYIIMQTLGKSLQTFYLDMLHFTSWPDEIKLLGVVQDLRFNNIRLTDLDANAFDGCKDSLTKLAIKNSSLNGVPTSICHLRNLSSLYFTSNLNSTLYEPCNRSIISVNEVQMEDNGLTHIPNLFELFPSMEHLSLKRNNISYIQSNADFNKSLLTEINLDDNQLSRIPYLLNNVANLTTLSIKNNKITTLEDPDLSKLIKLREIYLDDNPLMYITPNAFSNTIFLNMISLKRTLLTQLPNSLAELNRLQALYLFHVPIECDCSLWFMKTLNLSQTSIYGNCRFATKTIASFITNNLTNCIN